MKTILITGGAGFIGSALIRYIIHHTNDQVINIDKLSYASNINNLASVQHHPRYIFQQADIARPEQISPILQTYTPDMVMNLAAETHVDNSIHQAEPFIQTNIVGTFQLLESVRQYWQMLPEHRRISFRFHHISTDEVYGDLGEQPDPFHEHSPYAPSNPYSASKASSDHLVRAWHRTYGLPTLISHCSNNYGAYQFPEKFIPKMILSALQGLPLPIYGSGQQIRDWIYVDDHVKALYQIVNKGKIGETYHIGTHTQKSNLEVVKQICTLLNELAPRPHGSYHHLISHVTDRAGHDTRYAIDASKLQTELAWTPQESFETGLRKTVQWYLHHPQWWDSSFSTFPTLLPENSPFSGSLNEAI